MGSRARPGRTRRNEFSDVESDPFTERIRRVVYGPLVTVSVDAPVAAPAAGTTK